MVVVVDLVGGWRRVSWLMVARMVWSWLRRLSGTGGSGGGSFLEV